jgi:DivIVA domain-containing protein
VRRARLSRPQRGQRGYHADQVDAFLERAADALAGRAELTAEQVRSVMFEVAPEGRGYDQREVDHLLDRVERQLAFGRIAPTRLRTGADLRAVRLPKGVRGYDAREVDAFLDRASSTLDGHGGMTSFEVRSTRFATAPGLRLGYRVDAVDALLDELEQELRSRGR